MTQAKRTVPSAGAEVVTIGLEGAERHSVPMRLFGAKSPDVCDAGLGDLTAARLRQVPAVVAPAVGPDHDAVDVAKRLRRARFAGRLVVVVDDCPDEEVVRRDVSAAAPDVSVAVVALGRRPRLLAS